MAKKSFTSEQIISILRQAEVKIAQGTTVLEICREQGIAEQTYYRWRKEYGGIRTDGAKKLKNLEKENDRLKRLIGELSIENAILKDAAKGN
jgi:transposase-like protein